MSINMSICKHLTSEIKKPCDYYLKPGMCSRQDMFRCVEYIKKYESNFSISYSALKDFDKCPRAYYYRNIAGQQLIIQSNPLKIGKLVDSILSGKSKEVEQVKGLFVHSDIEDNPMWLAKAMSIVNSIKELGYDKQLEGYEKQREFNVNIQNNSNTDTDNTQINLHGFIDFAGTDHFCELKCSGNPDNYLDSFTIEDQVSTYFLSNPNYNYVNMLVIRVPDIKLAKGKMFEYKDYYTKCYDDILRRPSYYFVGKNDTWGVRFYRTEFDLEALKTQIRWICGEIKRCVNSDYWMQRKSSCFSPFRCDYLDICKTGVISPDRYEKRKIKV